MTRLREIFHNHLTLGSDKWDPYFDVYELYFSKYIGKPITFVEVGVQRGGSIEMWRKFFGPDAKIIGIDFDPTVAQLADKFDENTELVLGDQADPNFWRWFFEKYPAIDVFLDDGGHTMPQQITTLECVFPHIKLGGTYLCEDTVTSYFSEFEQIAYESRLYNPNSFMEYSKRIIDLLNYNHIEAKDRPKIRYKTVEMFQGLSSMHFYESMVVFLKNGRKDFRRVYSLTNR